MPNFMFKPGDTIEERYYVQDVLGQGAFSEVYKVLDNISNHTYALKILKDDYADRATLNAEFNILTQLHHPNIIRVYDVDLIRGKTYFLKLDYVASTPLKERITERNLSFAQVREITIAVLDALKYLKENQVIHMDIKPSNILMSDKGPVLIDFNISRQDVTSTSTIAGTHRYQPPEVELRTGKWRPASDLYSLSVVVFEMLAGRYPFTNEHPKEKPPDPRKLPDCPVSDSLAELLLKAIAYKPEDRFQSPSEMLEWVERVDWERQPTHISNRALFDSIDISKSEPNKQNHNPYLTRLLTLYSQSQRTNVGTRGFDDLAQATYVDTLLDRRLKDEILGGKYKLIIISGNAGDGKTAFIQKFETDLRASHETVGFISQPNGAELVHKGIRYVTNYDGSQDEGNTDNDQVLLKFFEPFMGAKPPSKHVAVHIIALNEGRLLDFLHHHSEQFSYLRDVLLRTFAQDTHVDENLLLVNLNLRSVVWDDESGVSIFDQMIDRFSSPELWERCSPCDLKERCYVKFNVDSVRDTNYGRQIKDRIETLFRIAHFRHRLHITIRDLRSALSYMLFGTLDCDGIHALEKEPSQRAEYLSRFYFSSLFPRSVVDAEEPIDRTVSLLSEVDPGKVTNPVLDGRLALGPSEEDIWSFPPFDTRVAADTPILQELFKGVEDRRNELIAKQSDDDTWAEFMEHFREVHTLLRRKFFFERTDDAWINMLPYQIYQDFYKLVTDPSSEILQQTKNELLAAITSSEILETGQVGNGDLVLRTSQDKSATVKGFRRFSREKFSCEIEGNGTAYRLMEYLPSSVILRYEGGISLDVDLDLFEMLRRVSEGFRPSVNELRGSYVNLLIFKRQLANEPYQEIILKSNDGMFHRIHKTAPGKLHLERL